MASQVKTPPSPVRPAPAEAGEQYIERQLRRTRRQVKVVDLSASLALLATGLLAALLLLAVVDHWILALGFWGRLFALVGIIAGVCWYTIVAIVPLLARPINPVYAARAIEQSAPSLKNSLINFLLLRSRPSQVHKAVYKALQDRAAADLSHVSVDTAVDRSRLIRVGYILAGVLVLCALYTILSPKDPFQTVSRVGLPWADIARPSRVEITDVRPGDADVFQGEQPTVSARIRGVGAEEGVTLVYSTSDGQIKDRLVDLKSPNRGLLYEAVLPPDEGGIQQDIVYFIRAGDAQTRAYRLRVSPAPAIFVERVDYEFPAYTKRSARTDKGEGDIKALEGTRVTVRARANYPIRSASLDFDPLQAAESGKDGQRDQRVRLPMDFQGVDASATFTLQLQADRRTPLHSTYQITFVTEEGRASENHVLHQIDVLPDLGPEIEVLTPKRDRVEVPVGGEQRIEIRALDPDFGLRRIRLRAVVGGVDLLNTPLVDDSEGAIGQTTANYVIQPRQLGLAAGDHVVFWAVAEDNRMSPLNGAPEANVQRTRNHHLTITAPPPGAEDESSSAAEENRDDSPPSEEGAAADAGQGEGVEQEGGAGSQQDPSASEEGGESDPGQQGQPSEGSAESSPDAMDGDSTAEGAEAQQPEPGQTQPGQAGESQQPGGGTPQEGAAGEQPQDELREEPLHDGEVFEQALEQMREESSGDASSAEQGQGSGSTQGASSENEQPSETADSDTQQPDAGSKPTDSNNNDTPADGAKSPGTDSQQPSTEHPASEPPGAENGPTEPQQGMNPDAKEPGATKQPQESQPGDETGKGQPNPQPGDASSKEGPPEGRAENRERPSSSDSPGDASNEPEPPSMVEDERSSDTQGESSGDRRGEGKQGPGQSSNQAGNDGAGSHNTADEGAGAAPEPGDGEMSSSPGEQEEADGQTGNSGDQKGPGSSTQHDPTGNEPGAETLPDSSADQSAGETNPPSSSQRGAGATPGDGMPTGGGVPADGPENSFDEALEVPDSDEPNLEYARRVTDMVLEYLDQQKDRPDSELLDKLNWSDEDLRKFLQRWRALKDSAHEDDVGQRELDENLRGLGLKPAGDRLRRGRQQRDDLPGLRESGLRMLPPSQYLEQFDAFKKGTARNRD